MIDGIMAILGDDGVFHEYDDTYDIVIHCESKKEQDAFMNKVKNSIPREKIDEMIAEIENYGNDYDPFTVIQDVLTIIHKYCDKEQKNE